MRPLNPLAARSYRFLAHITAIRSSPPSHGTPGVTTVTLSGRGFGTAQGTGQVWLGTATATVQSWSDTAVTATVGMGSANGGAMILSGCFMSNALPFTIDLPHIDDVTPSSGVPGSAVTITGTGFGASPGNVQLGSLAGAVTVGAIRPSRRPRRRGR
jgi:hypothetical protein